MLRLLLLLLFLANGNGSLLLAEPCLMVVAVALLVAGNYYQSIDEYL